MSGGFSFPLPPPPPPKASLSSDGQQGQQQHHGFRGRGRGRGAPRGANDQRGWGSFVARGHHTSAYYEQQPSSNHHEYRQQFPSGVYLNPNFSSSQSVTLGTIQQPNQSRQVENSAPLVGYHMPEAASPPRTVAGHKRKLDAIRGLQHGKTKQPGPQTAPAVPSFGAPIVSVDVQSRASGASKMQPNKAKQRPASKGLGLIPATDGIQPLYSDSEDEKEVDEEAMHAELGAKLTFQHNGVVMSLKSQADLAAWKRERQKNWPTQARMAKKDEERRRIGEERKRLLASAGSWEHLPQRRGSKSKRKRRSGSGGDVANASNYQNLGQAKVENPGSLEGGSTKLEIVKQELTEQQKRLYELRRKVAESEARNREAKAEKMKRDYENGVAADGTVESQGAQQDAVDLGIDGGSSQENNLEDDEGMSDIYDESSMEFSSSNSSGSTSDSESDNEAPEEITSKPPAETIPESRKPFCKDFAAKGYCRYGEACRFRHEQPSEMKTAQVQPQHRQEVAQKRAQGPDPTRSQPRSERKSIFQRLVEQEQNEEDRLALQVIKYLGKAGFFKQTP